MRIVILFVVCVALLPLALGATSKPERFTSAQYETHFSDWMHTHSKSYTAADFIAKFTVFKQNLDFIDEFNRGNATFKVGLNVFSDLTVDQFRDLLLHPFPAAHTRALEDAPEWTGEGVKVARDTVDWRTKGAVTAIKDQGQCGSCWTFAAAGTIESVNQLATGNLVQLSEQNLLDCERQYSQGCNGGSYMAAYSWVQQNGGIDTMASYPYKAAQASACGFSTASVGATITGYTRVTANSESALLTAVASQPVAVGIQGDLATFQHYASGTYSDSSCTSAKINHAVQAIGYGTDANGDYWLIKNSWGTYWGQSGYGQIARGINMCGIAAQAAFPTKPRSTSTTAAPSTSAPTTTRSSGSTSAPVTTAKPATTSAPVTTAKPATTSAPVTSTGSASSGIVFTDSLGSGWTLAYSGSVTAISACGTGAAQTGSCGVSANLGAQATLAFARSAAFSTSGFTTLKFSIKTSSNGFIGFGFGTSSASTTSTSTAWKTVSTPLSSLGSPASVTTIGFSTYTATTIYIDNVQFA